MMSYKQIIFIQKLEKVGVEISAVEINARTGKGIDQLKTVIINKKKESPTQKATQIK